MLQLFKYDKKPDSDKPLDIKILSKNEFDQCASVGISVLFDVETDIGGFRFLHVYTKLGKATYIISFFKEFKGPPIHFSLQLEDFHMYVTYWFLGNQLFANEPNTFNPPYANLVYCLTNIVKEQNINTSLH